MGRFGNHFHGQVANTADMLLFKNVKRKFKKEEDSVSGKEQYIYVPVISKTLERIETFNTNYKDFS